MIIANYRMDKQFEPPWRWGVFIRKPCQTLYLERNSIHYQSMAAIYEALKKLGFRETYWQYVYQGQIGGLIKNISNNMLELHVRFFDDGLMYAEIELGRSALVHFFKKRCYANEYIARKLSAYLDENDARYLQDCFDRYKVERGCNWPEWNMANKFITDDVRALIKIGHTLADWRFLAVAMFLGVVAVNVHDQVIFPIATIGLIAAYLVAPKKF